MSGSARIDLGRGMAASWASDARLIPDATFASHWLMSIGLKLGIFGGNVGVTNWM